MFVWVLLSLSFIFAHFVQYPATFIVARELNILTHVFSMLHFTPPENIRTTYGLWFQEV